MVHEIPICNRYLGANSTTHDCRAAAQAFELGKKPQVLVHGQGIEEDVVLGTDAERALGVKRAHCHVIPVNPDRTARGGKHACNHPHGRRLA